MRVAVTGASGFVGRHVVAEFLRRKINVVAAAHRVTVDIPGAETVQLSLDSQDPYAVLGSPDAVVHLAWGGLPNYRSQDHFEKELPRQLAFCKALVNSGLKHLVVAGTCQEYGMQSGALVETMPPQPHTPYAVAKDMLRQELELLSGQQRFRLAWARLFYMFGEGQASSSIFPQLKAAVAAGSDVFDMSGGEQVRDYLPVEGIAAGLADLAEAGHATGVFNICSGVPISVRELVQGWLGANQWHIALNLGKYPYPDYEPMAFWGDRSRLDAVKSALGMRQANR